MIEGQVHDVLGLYIDGRPVGELAGIQISVRNNLQRRWPQWPAEVHVDTPRRRQHEWGMRGYICAICDRTMRQQAEEIVGCIPITGLPRAVAVGTGEGDLCLRSHDGAAPCLGQLVLRRADDMRGCSCFISAPCGSCMSIVPECPKCGHREDEP